MEEETMMEEMVMMEEMENLKDSFLSKRLIDFMRQNYGEL
jgi:hypothetical protein